jgi:hypothetical protein
MSQAQPSSTPPPLPGIVQLTDAEPIGGAHDKDEFFRELAETEGAATDQVKVRYLADVRTPVEAAQPAEIVRDAIQVPYPAGEMGSNVLPLGVWQNGAPPRPAHPVRLDTRPARPRSVRRTKQPASRGRHRAGRFAATLLALLGWLLVGAGLAASLITFLQPELSLRLAVPNLLEGATGVLVVGLATGTVGLAARAMFEVANAARELTVTIERQRSGLDQ